MEFEKNTNKKTQINKNSNKISNSKITEIKKEIKKRNNYLWGLFVAFIFSAAILVSSFATEINWSNFNSFNNHFDSNRSDEYSNKYIGNMKHIKEHIRANYNPEVQKQLIDAINNNNYDQWIKIREENNLSMRGRIFEVINKENFGKLKELHNALLNNDMNKVNQIREELGLNKPNHMFRRHSIKHSMIYNNKEN